MALDEQQTKADLINPALESRGWTLGLVAHEVKTGRVTSTGDWSPGTADYVLYVKISGAKEVAAVLEAKAVSKSPEAGARQAREYARSIKAPFAYATNGHVFVEVDPDDQLGDRRKLSEFPSPTEIRNAHPIELQAQAQERRVRESQEIRARKSQQRRESEAQERRERESQEIRVRKSQQRREREANVRRTTVPKALNEYQEQEGRPLNEIWRDEAEQVRQDSELLRRDRRSSDQAFGRQERRGRGSAAWHVTLRALARIGEALRKAMRSR